MKRLVMRLVCLCINYGALIIMIIIQFYWVDAESVKGLDLIRRATFDSYDDIRPVEEDAWYKGQNVSYKDNAVWLNPDPREVQTRASSNIGKIIYKNMVRFKYDAYHGVISFNTSFTFQIFTTRTFPDCGSGMTFFIADYAKAPQRSYGRYFGLVSPNATQRYRFFAVEFDTHMTEEFNDPSASHIGIDINTLKSIVTADSKPNSSSPFYPQLYLYNNYTFTAWIEYFAPENLIQLWMSNSTSSLRPSSPCLTLIHNLSNVFQDYMYVGFSASSNASEDSMEGHVLYSWNFTTYPPTSSKSSFSKLLVHVIVPLSIFLLICFCCVSLYGFVKAVKTRRQRIELIAAKHRRSCGSSKCGYFELPLGSTLVEYTYKELKRATENYANNHQIGEGAFSRVYKATLSKGQVVAIKRLKEGFQKEKEFSSEVKIISNIRHRYLLPLLGWCYDKGEAFLVYKYMSRGSLDNYLYGRHEGTLSSKIRLDILAKVASALAYLHNHLGDCVLHRDVKAANVLLTESFEPMLGDFGLARLVNHNAGSVTMTAAGSPGYVAPEVVFANKVTDKVDVYSFGILALVVASGRPALHRSTNAQQSEEVLLVDSVWMLHQGNQLMEVLDLDMRMDMPDLEKKQWECVLHVALMCANPSPVLRPTMKQVCQALEGDTVLLTKPLPAMRPMYRTSSKWPSASEVSFRNAGWSVSVCPPSSCQDSYSSPGQPPTTSFANPSENKVGR